MTTLQLVQTPTDSLLDVAARLEALGNPTRLNIFRMLVRAGEGGLPVGELQRRLDAAASTLSHHVRALVDVGLVSQERKKTTLICRAKFAVMQDLVSFLADECCADERQACGKDGCP